MALPDPNTSEVQKAVKRSIIFLASAIIFIFAAFVSGQETTPTPPPPPIETDDEVLTIESRLVIVPVSVTDGNGDPVKGLTKENFRLREKNRPQEITEVSAADKVPLEIALLFDVSASTDPMFRFEQETAAKFLEEVMRPEDRATIFTIGEMPVLLQNRNVAYRSIETIRNIKPTKQYTAFYDTVTAAAAYLRENAPPKSRRVIIAITDGEDTNSIGVKLGFSQVYAAIDRRKNSITTSELREMLAAKRNEIRVREQNKTLSKLQDADTVFYSINPAGSSYQLNKISKFGQENMERFATETGGTAFLPKFLPIDLKKEYERNANIRENTRTLEKIFRQLASELQSQYLIQYYSDREYPQGTFVDIGVDVDLNLPQGVRLRARQGYFVKD